MIKIEAIAAKLDFGTVFPPEKKKLKEASCICFYVIPEAFRRYSQKVNF